jgi:hypothetical protein
MAFLCFSGGEVALGKTVSLLKDIFSFQI